MKKGQKLRNLRNEVMTTGFNFIVHRNNVRNRGITTFIEDIKPE